MNNNKEWDGIESILDSINYEIEDLNSTLVEIKRFRLGMKAKVYVAHLCSVVENLKQYSDSLYGKCQTYHTKGYEEVLELLPNGSKLSVGEVLALIEHIKTWRKEYGYPEV